MSADKKAKVSAIISAYNSGRFFRQCLEDLCAQTLFQKGELEIVAIISGSEENEEEIAREYQALSDKVIYLRTARETMYEAWNRGIQIASGEYLSNANTDDRHRVDAFEVMSRTLDENPDVDLVYGDSCLSRIENETFEQNSQDQIYYYPAFFAPAAVLYYQFSPQPMWRKTVHEKIGNFDGTRRCVGDYDFNLKLALHSKAMHVDDTPTGLYLEHPEALSFKDDRIDRETRELQAAYRSEERIEQLYRQAGVLIDTDEQRAQVHLDMGIRALEYYPPWYLGNFHREPEFAIECFERVLKIAPDWVAAKNNAGIAYAFANQLKDAIKLVEQATQAAEDIGLIENLAELRKIKDNGEHPGNLKIAPSNLPFPSQQELASPEGVRQGIAIL